MMERLCHDALLIFKAAVRAVKPEVLIPQLVKIRPPSTLEISQKTYPLSHNVYVVGLGKAVYGMAVAVENIVDSHMVSGILSVPKGIVEQYKNEGLPVLQDNTRFKVFEGASNNIPDAEAVTAASSIIDLVTSLKESDLLLVLISGGGSALLPHPLPEITLENKLDVVKSLFQRGAPIQEINTVRKRLSAVKGGGLALAARPAQVVSLILSDIVGDPVDLIASGPTVKNVDDPSLPLEILSKYNLTSEVPENVISALKNTSKEVSDKEPFDHVTNIIIGSNRNAVTAAAEQSSKLNHITVTLTRELEGPACDVGQALANLACAVLKKDETAVKSQLTKLKLPVSMSDVIMSSASHCVKENKILCLVCAGETVVEVTGNGTGGRNQELALTASLELHTLNCDKHVVILSAGTDGIDGPTTAAGAIGSAGVIEAASYAGLNPIEFLNDNDSFNFYKILEDGRWHVITGHTGTNVMDIVLVLIKLNN